MVAALSKDLTGLEYLSADQIRLGEAGYLAERAVDPQELAGSLPLDPDDGHPDRGLLERGLEQLLSLVRPALEWVEDPRGCCVVRGRPAVAVT